MDINEITGRIISAAMKIHSTLGPGLLENVYEACLHQELLSTGMKVERQVELPVIYNGLRLDPGYRLDLLVEKKVIVEIKSIETVLPVHPAQLLTYLKLSDKRVGLLINFNVPHLKSGIKRIVNRYVPEGKGQVSPE